MEFTKVYYIACSFKFPWENIFVIFADIDIHHYYTVASPILEAAVRKLLLTKNLVIEIMKLFKHRKFEYYIFGATWYVLDSVHHTLYIHYNA